MNYQKHFQENNNPMKNVQISSFKETNFLIGKFIFITEKEINTNVITTIQNSSVWRGRSRKILFSKK
jgi:hypothetical protein